MASGEEATAVEGTAVDEALVESFRSITSSSRDEAAFFLESHQGDLNAAVSTFFDSGAAAAPSVADDTPPAAALSPSPSRSASPSPSESRSASPSLSRSRSPSPPVSRAAYSLRSRQVGPPSPSPAKRKAAVSSGGRGGGVRTLADLNKVASDGSDDSDSDGTPEYYTGGEKSGMLVQDPSKANDVTALFDQARQARAMERPADKLRPSSSSRNFTGTGRRLTGETVPSAPQPPEVVNHTVIFWADGFTVDDGPLRRLDDPANAPFLESIRKSECPKELEPVDRSTRVNCDLMRRSEKYPQPVKRQRPFQGVARTLGSSSDTAEEVPQPTIASSPLASAPLPSPGLMVDDTLPSTSIQLRLSDGTRMVSRFNYHHTVRDIRAFIDASRPGGPRSYQLQTMDFPPKQLADENQTIEQASLANSVVIQKF